MPGDKLARMHETPDELRRVQSLLDASFERGSDHLKSIMTPEWRLSAGQLVAQVPTPAVLNIASVTRKGEPRISAVDGHFLHGRWYFGTAAASPKAVQLRDRPAISASYTPRDGFGIFSHGRAALLDGAEREMLHTHFAEHYGSDPDSWGSGSIAYFRIDADWLVAFAMPETPG